jgi:hypothetical protein
MRVSLFPILIWNENSFLGASGQINRRPLFFAGGGLCDLRDAK